MEKEIEQKDLHDNHAFNINAAMIDYYFKKESDGPNRFKEVDCR